MKRLMRFTLIFLMALSFTLAAVLCETNDSRVPDTEKTPYVEYAPGV